MYKKVFLGGFSCLLLLLCAALPFLVQEPDGAPLYSAGSFATAMLPVLLFNPTIKVLPLPLSGGSYPKIIKQIQYEKKHEAGFAAFVGIGTRALAG